MSVTNNSAPPETILVVEDNDADAFLLNHCFQKLNRPYTLQVVGNGWDAIKYLAGREIFRDREQYPFPGLLFLDMNLPLVDGQEVLDWVRQNELPEKLLVYLLTGHSEGGNMVGSLEMHGKTCIVRSRFLKPPTIEGVGMMLNFYETWKSRKSHSGLGARKPEQMPC